MADIEEMGFPLADTIQQLRGELQHAMAEGAHEQLRFRIDGLEVDLTITVGRAKEGGGGIKFWVVNANAKHKANEVQTHTIKLKLSPMMSEGGEILIEGSSPDKPNPKP